MHKNKIYVLQMIMSITLIFIVNFSLSFYSFAEENEATDNTSNEVRPLTLQEQQNQVNEELAQANDELTYVESELSNKMLNIQKIEDKISEFSKK